MYSKYARKLEDSLSTCKEKHISSKCNTVFQKLENELVKILPLEEEFYERFMQFKYVNSTPGRIKAKYILGKINSELRQTDEYQIDFDKTSAEHILPQSPEQWGLSKDEIKSYVHLLGNITLLSSDKNSRVGNKPPNEKKAILGELS